MTINDDSIQAESPLFAPPTSEENARYRRERALEYALRVAGKRTDSASIIRMALEFDGFLSGATSPTAEDLREEVRHYAETIKSLEITIENLQKPRPAMESYTSGYDAGAAEVLGALRKRRTELGLKLHDRVTVGQVLREIEDIEERIQNAASF